MNKISIIVPVYNAEHTIRRCVESLVYGAERNIEVILSEDCSKDNSWAVCCQLAEEYSNVTAIRNEKNSGVSHTRNKGLDIAKGEYILFVDSDDWVSGNYVKRLIQTAEQNQQSMVICGSCFHDETHGTQYDYLWEKNGKATYTVPKEDFFDLMSKVLLQALWNKVFRRDIIEQYNIRFDESQSMGEDFQFVLDYLEFSQIEQCVVLNETLYHYIRWGNSSLMSKFGLVENENDNCRLSQLLRICGEENPKVQEKYKNAVDNSKNNFVYQAMHSKQYSKEEKLAFIEKIAGAENAKSYYITHKKILLKEQIAKLYNKLMQFPSRLDGRIQREKNNRLVAKLRPKLKNKDVSVISQNCIGGVFSHDMGLQFLSPTVNLYFSADDFVKFVRDLPRYLDMDIQMEMGEKFPIGKLGDVTVYFMHYESCTGAKAAWNRRKSRVNLNKILVLCTDMEGFDDETFNQWQQIQYPKVLFTANTKFAEFPGTVFFSHYEKNGKVNDLIPKREFYRNDILISILEKC